MDTQMTLFYLLMLTFVALVVFAGYDETMRLVRYLDLQVRYAYIKIQMKWMERKLRKKLLEDISETQSLKEFNNGK
tara:strand:+ start:1398 stop:1625 length:228 start_codon:yes stop_codon:yes gene_type:complete